MIEDIITAAITGAVAGLLAAGVVTWLWGHRRNSDIRDIESELDVQKGDLERITNTLNSRAAADKKAIRDDQMQNVMAQVPGLMKDGKIDMAVVAKLAAENPELTQLVAKKLMGGLKL